MSVIKKKNDIIIVRLNLITNEIQFKNNPYTLYNRTYYSKIKIQHNIKIDVAINSIILCYKK